MKEVAFRGNALEELRSFPPSARREARLCLDRGQKISGARKGAGIMNDAVFASVWDAIEDTPAEAANMRLRADLMQAIQRTIRDRGWSRKEAARRLGA